LNLSKTEQRFHDLNLQRLIAAGVVVGEQKPTEKSMLRIEQTGGPHDSVLWAPAIGGYVIAVWLRIVALKAGISVCDCAIVPRRWQDSGIYLLEPPDRLPFYKDIAGIDYPKNDVLNHQIFAEHVLRWGDVLDGVLVAQSFTPPPDWCSTGMTIESELCFFDQFDNQYPLIVELNVTREAKRVQPANHHPAIFRADGKQRRPSAIGGSEVRGERH
jgi:hypothetical protein